MMVTLRVAPWQRNGHDRLDVFVAETGDCVAWYDRTTGRIEIEEEQHRDAVLDVLAPYLRGGRDTPEQAPRAGRVEAEATPPPVRSSGSAAGGQAAIPGPRRGNRVLSLLLGARADATEPETAGEQHVASRFSRLTRQGWRLLHSVGLASGADVDHVIIGPGGVFTVNAKHHPGARVRAGARVVSIDGNTQSYILTSRREAMKVARLLTSACGFPVTVTPILAFVGATSVKNTAPMPDILVLRADDIERVLARQPERLSAATSDRIYAAARQHAWLAG
jgi:hypothetical protein